MEVKGVGETPHSLSADFSNSSEDSVLAVQGGQASMWPLLHSNNGAIGRGQFLSCSRVRQHAYQHLIKGVRTIETCGAVSAPTSPTPAPQRPGRGRTPHSSVHLLSSVDQSPQTLIKPTTPTVEGRQAPRCGATMAGLSAPPSTQFAIALSVGAITQLVRLPEYTGFSPQAAPLGMQALPINSEIHCESSYPFLPPTPTASSPIVIPTGVAQSLPDWQGTGTRTLRLPQHMSQKSPARRQRGSTARGLNNSLQNVSRFEKRPDQGWQPVMSTADKLDRFLEQRWTPAVRTNANLRLHTEPRNGSNSPASPMRDRRNRSQGWEGTRSARPVAWGLNQPPSLTLTGLPWQGTQRGNRA
mmetsp:Transcript_23892/g.66285  ORF Transcript_23892/g.66285 Transcript_23892/m.66285 type:complete len:356 (+) Transcript_23892:1582-2649(+)